MSEYDQPEGFDAVSRMLQEQRPELDPLALDRVKARARQQARRNRPGRESTMKTRLAMIAVLALGILMSATGATLAIDSTSGDGSASDDGVYETTTISESSDPVDPGDPGDPVDPARQSGTGGGDLPFTGFLAVPLLIGGVALLGSGMVIRRRAGS